MEYKIKKPVRLIELFAGIGAQAKALEILGVDFEHHFVCEIDKNAVKSYNAVHGTNFSTTDITELKGTDLNITERDKYEYILSYSYPCVSISLAGKREGMEKASNTKSSLLWEVERLLQETPEKPQILLMENVTECHKGKNYKPFEEWLAFLRDLGYKSYYFDMNAKEYGLPQSRNRCFVVSILGGGEYYPPTKSGLFHTVREYLEPVVDEKYFLNDDTAKALIETLDEDVSMIDDTYGFSEMTPRTYTDVAPTLRACHATDIKCIVCASRGRPIENPSLRVSGLPTQQRLEAVGGETSNTITTVGKDNLILIYDDYNSHIRDDQTTIGTITTTIGNRAIRNGHKIIENKRLRTLTEKEAWRLMGFSDKDFEKAQRVTPKTSLSRQAGNSICVNCLVAVFGQLFEGKEGLYRKRAYDLMFADGEEAAVGA